MNVPIYEERLQRDLNKIRDMIAEVAEEVEKSLRNAVQALLRADRKLAYQTVLGDHVINRSILKIDRQCHFFVAKHLPSAGHLRFISSVLRLTIGLERLGDYAATIAREAVQFTEPHRPTVVREIEHMSRDAFQMLNQAIRSFNERNPELARGTMGYADNVERSFEAVFEELVEAADSGKRNAAHLFGTLVVFNMLERVSDQAKNICEDTVFAVTGETKKRKSYRILFLDRKNDFYSQMATAIAKKVYPNSGQYSGAGKQAAETIDPELNTFMTESGYDMTQAKSREANWVPEEWASFHVIVCLEGKLEDYTDQVPFHTSVLEWELPPPPAKDLSADEKREQFSAIHGQLANDIEDLIILLRGEDHAD